jgi:acetoacetyl-CoA synthetase
MPLFLVLNEGASLDEDLKARITDKLRKEVSPRHVPNEMLVIDEVPYTLSGKKMEIPVRKILLGMDAGSTLNPGAMRNPDAIDFFRRYGERLNQA